MGSLSTSDAGVPRVESRTILEDIERELEALDTTRKDDLHTYSPLLGNLIRPMIRELTSNPTTSEQYANFLENELVKKKIFPIDEKSDSPDSIAPYLKKTVLIAYSNIGRVRTRSGAPLFLLCPKSARGNRSIDTRSSPNLFPRAAIDIHKSEWFYPKGVMLEFTIRIG